MAKKNYSEKLRNPQWQKKRLEILQRDSFTCLLCSDTTTELHVHHKEYIYGNEPWEYPNDNFETYCKHCHLVCEDLKEDGIKIIAACKAHGSDGFINYYSITSVPSCDELCVTIYRINPNGTCLHLINVKQSTVTAINNLFEFSKILTPETN